MSDDRFRVAVLDDWQDVAQSCADWSALQARAEVVFFRHAFADEDHAARELAGFEVIMAMRERTPFPPSLINRLPRLKLFAMTGHRSQLIDLPLLIDRDVLVCFARSTGHGSATAELALGLMLAAIRRIAAGDAAMRRGEFQENIASGYELFGKTLGIIGLGRLGARLARFGAALDMEVIAWSQNLTAERAAAAGAKLVTKDELLGRSDVISLHLVLGERSRGIIGAAELAQMKHGAVLVNTARGPLIDEPALIAALRAGRIIAALDVYDREPLPTDHPLRGLPNVVLTPHLGYVLASHFDQMYRGSVANVLAWLDGKPINILPRPTD